MKKAIIIMLILSICLTLTACIEKNEYDIDTVTEDYEYEDSYESVYSQVTESTNSITNYFISSESSGSEKTKFSITGKWKNIGEGTFGQAQKGAIIIFDGTYCNFFSPRDTYAFYYSDDGYHLDCTSFLFGDTLNFEVNIKDNDNIEITRNTTTVQLMRVY